MGEVNLETLMADPVANLARPDASGTGGHAIPEAGHVSVQIDVNMEIDDSTHITLPEPTLICNHLSQNLIVNTVNPDVLQNLEGHTRSQEAVLGGSYRVKCVNLNDSWQQKVRHTLLNWQLKPTVLRPTLARMSSSSAHVASNSRP